MIGLKRNTVRLVPHQKGWKHEFQKERKRIIRVLGDWIIDIEHIGSTSIPGMPAKPVIDMQGGIPTVKITKKQISQLRNLGYQFMPKRSTPSRLFSVKGPPARRTHHLHLVKFGGREWQMHPAFRDYLKKHKKIAAAYASLKLKLAEQFPNNREAYRRRKNKFILKIVRLAIH